MASKVVLSVVSVFVGGALMGHVLERRTGLECHCGTECWCRKPILSILRWVIPKWHRCDPAPEELSATS